MVTHVDSLERVVKITLKVTLEQFRVPIKFNLTNHLSVDALRWRVGDPIQFEVKDTDKKGFYIRISKGGSKRWYYRYTKNKKVRSLSLGPFPEISCADAFSDYEKYREQVRHGRDPYLERRLEREEEMNVEERSKFTVSVLFNDHYLLRYSKKNLRTWKNDRTYFESKIEPAIGHLPAADVTPQDVEELVMPIERGGNYATARLTLATLRKMYNWALKNKSAVNPGDGPLLDGLNPCRLYELGDPPPTIDRNFSEDEIPSMWSALGIGNTGRIAKLQLLTGCRVTEIAGMRWSEIDLNGNTWTLPRTRAKNRKLALLVPLTDRMLSLIGKQGSGDFVFPAKSATGHTLGTSVLGLIKKRCKSLGLEKAGSHTMRKTFTTQMAKLGVHLEIRNRLTNRIDSTIDFKNYNFYDYYQEKQSALVKWDKELTRMLGKTGQ